MCICNAYVLHVAPLIPVDMLPLAVGAVRAPLSEVPSSGPPPPGGGGGGGAVLRTPPPGGGVWRPRGLLPPWGQLTPPIRPGPAGPSLRI